MEWLKAKQVAAMVGASVHEGVGAGDAAQPPEWVEAAPGATGLDWSGGDGQEPGLTIGTLEAVEVVEAATSARGAGQAVVAKIRDAVETPQDVREEEKQPELQMEREEPQQQRAAARVARAAVVAAAGGGAA
jgi:bifunctional ADP-heptose synthase (sugar kinase/adenylyltransferase)